MNRVYVMVDIGEDEVVLHRDGDRLAVDVRSANGPSMETAYFVELNPDEIAALIAALRMLGIGE